MGAEPAGLDAIARGTAGAPAWAPPVQPRPDARPFPAGAQGAFCAPPQPFGSRRRGVVGGEGGGRGRGGRAGRAAETVNGTGVRHAATPPCRRPSLPARALRRIAAALYYLDMDGLDSLAAAAASSLPPNR